MEWIYTGIISTTTLIVGIIGKIIYDWLKTNKGGAPPGFADILFEIKQDIKNIFSKLDDISNGYTKICDFKELGKKHECLKSKCDEHFGEYKAFQAQVQDAIRGIEKRK